MREAVTTSRTDPPIISVSELNRSTKRLLQTQLGMLWVRGEISNFSRPHSGHWYFTLKDDGAQIRCAMFKGRNIMMRYLPKEGDQIIVRGKVGLYEPRGDYQLIAEHLEAEGEGRLRQAFEQLKAKLSNAGLFEPQHKQALPQYPRHIAVISSKTGAVIHDICSVFQRRWPLCQISILPCRVQGNQAAQEITDALNLANQYATQLEPAIDAIIIARGGGSLEDLQAFNDEQLAHAIFNSRLAVVSAVGHETDFSISDFVADQRAATPSAAAELLSPSQDELKQHFDQIELQLKRNISYTLQQRAQQLRNLSAELKHPQQQLNDFKQQCISTHQILKHSILYQLSHSRQRLAQLQLQLSFLQPVISEYQQSLTDNSERLANAAIDYINLHRQRLTNNTSLLNTVSPLATLQRGYAIVSDEHQTIVRDSEKLKPQQLVQITLAQGQFKARVEKNK